ncbi:ABC transporter ATP-binding protein [Streptomyces sp. 8ZJF_21]|uniref:ABC transporter ATP-binding protein n=1 Tax=Streptomyces sp. 8ZJF_21 TaxID=2903141 RepID=UPI001E2F1EAD|nr:ABC transporter ATP-binding protein [Streptomyces sp. 8ZJF_21]MCD9588295.1 ABC transporter ATP-binding protein [Streptomyces sp. 8ZJF_21]
MTAGTETVDTAGAPTGPDTAARAGSTRGRLVLEGIHKALGGKAVVRGIDLTMEPGEFLTLLGPSGCGKSTTLNMVAGHLLPDSGVVEVDGRDITRLPANRRAMGMVFQSYALFPHMTVAENIAFGLRMRKVGAARRRRRAAEALELVGLDGMGERYPRQLSGGQRQRTALARALIVEPDLLLLDEPFSNLDAQLRVRLREEVAALQRRVGTTTILVTHDQDEALAVSDRIAVMAEGTIHQLDAPETVYLRPATDFVAQFVGEVNVLDGIAAGASGAGHRCRIGDTHLVTATPVGTAPGDGEAVRLYVRPEAVRVLAVPEEGRSERPPADTDISAAGASVDTATRPGLPGTVEATRFLGTRVRCVVATAAGRVEATLPFGSEVPTLGEEVICAWQPQHASLTARP